MVMDQYAGYATGGDIRRRQCDPGAGGPVLFYAALDKRLGKRGFNEGAEETCREFCAERMARPSLPPGVHSGC